MKFGVNLVMDFLPLLFPGLAWIHFLLSPPLPPPSFPTLLFHSIRPTHDATSSPHGTASRLRAHGFLESILSNPHVKLRTRQPKSPCGLRFVSAAIVQDLRNRGAFDGAEIGGVIAE